MADCTYPKCQQTAIPGCQGLCRDLSVNRRATDAPPAGDAGQEPYVEVTVRIGDAVARKVATRVEFEKSHYPRQMAHYLADFAIADAIAASNGEKG